MNKQFIILLGIVFFLFLGSYLALKLVVENLIAEKAKTEELIAVLQNQRLGLIAQVQALENEARVIPIAETELGLVREVLSPYHIDVVTQDIERIRLRIEKNHESK